MSEGAVGSAGTAAVSSANQVGNSGKNVVGYVKGAGGGATNRDYDKGRSNDAAPRGGGKDRKKALYGFKSSGPDRAKIPSTADEPKTKKRVRVQTEDANPDKATQATSKKINKKVVKIATATGGDLSHARVGRAQKMASFGSHRRTHNWVQPGVKKQLLGPFSDHLGFKQRTPGPSVA